jgi:non-canonical purine NTP pyrophosphatase (RdgB/HAM1 family)
MEMIAATNNGHKLEEIRAILESKGIEVKSMADVGLDIEIEENGDTFIENALIKAREVFRLTGEAAIADDSGLEVDALNGEPGVRSARYSGVAGADKDGKNNEKLKKALRDIPDDKRGARFCSAIAAVFPDGEEIIVEGYVYGKIGYLEKGEHGFGYDPLFIVDGYGRTMAEIDSSEKNKISHRANALKEFVNKLEEIHIYNKE